MTMINCIKAQNGFQNISIFFESLKKIHECLFYMSFNTVGRYTEIATIQFKTNVHST